MGFISSGVILAPAYRRPKNIDYKDGFNYVAHPVSKLEKGEILYEQYTYPLNSSFIGEVGNQSVLALAGVNINVDDTIPHGSLSSSDTTAINGNKSFLKKVHFDKNIRKVPTDYFNGSEPYSLQDAV